MMKHRKSSFLIGFLVTALSPCMQERVLATCYQSQPTEVSELPEFEVASIKPSPPASPLSTRRVETSWGKESGAVRLQEVPLSFVIRQVYGLREDQLVGPPFLQTERFDFLAAAPAGRANEVPQMFQRLLAERFGLRFHWETREAWWYALVIAPGGPKLEKGLPDSGGEIKSSGKIEGEGYERSFSVSGRGNFGDYRMKITAKGAVQGVYEEFLNITMRELAANLQNLDLPVFNMTGLEGTYHLSLDRQVTLGEPLAPATQEALKKLGLKLERKRLPRQYFVIDNINRMPSEN